jgi:hypothetical protein
MFNFTFVDPKDIAPTNGNGRKPTITITATRLHIPPLVQKLMPKEWGREFVRLGFDETAGAIGIAPDIPKGKMAIPVQRRKNDTLSVIGMGIIVRELKIDVGKSGQRRIPVRWDADEQMLIAEVPQEMLMAK